MTVARFRNFYLLLLCTTLICCKKKNDIPDITSGLVAYYPFNGNANDESGNGNNGKINGATLTNDRFGNANKAYIFNGIDSRIYIDKEFFNNGWQDYSICGWYNLTSSSNPNNINNSFPLINSSPHNGMAISLNWQNTQKYSVWLGNGAPSISWNRLANTKSNASLVVLNWTFFTLTKKGNVISLFIGENLDKTWDLTEGIQPYPYKLYLGGVDPANSNEVFLGKLDDIRIYNRLLTQEQITYLATH